MPEPLPDFGNIHFDGTLRPSQKAASDVIIPQLESGATRLHVVVPYGSINCCKYKATCRSLPK
jgi:hypothetical protein